MKNIIFSMIASVLVGCSCQSSDKKEAEKTPANNALTQEVFNPEASGYQLVWEDNFEGTQLDTAKWKTRMNGPRRIGYNDPSMTKVENGNLLLMYDIRKDSILAGAVGTGDTYRPVYGYFECRAKLQKGAGLWSAFWFQAPLISDGEDPGKFGAEIDIFEYFKERGNDVLTHCIHWAYGPNQKSCGPMISNLKGLSEGFHTFALEWTDTQYSFYIDGLKFHEKTEGISHTEEYMILSMELPGQLEAIKNACAPDTFMVDYVKVYQKGDK